MQVRKTLPLKFCYVSVCLIIVVLFCFTELKANNEEQATILIESEAKKLSKVWKYDEINRSILLFKESAENWIELAKPRRAAFCLRESGKLLIILSKNEEAIKLFKKAKNIDFKANHIDGQIETLSQLSLLYSQIGNFKKSKIYAQKAIKLSKLTTSFESKAFANFALGELNFYLSNLLKSQNYLIKAHSLASETANRNLQAKTLLNQSIILAIHDNEELAFDYLKKAQTMWIQQNNKRGQALIYDAYGYLHVVTNEYKKALSYYNKADKLIPSNIDFYLRAKIYVGKSAHGLTYDKSNLAITNLSKAVEYFEKANNEIGQLAILPDLVLLHHLQGNLEIASSLLSKTLLLEKKIESEFWSLYLNEVLGFIDFSEGNYEDAIKKYKGLHKAYKKNKTKFPLILNTIANAYLKMGKNELAKKYYDLSLEESQQTNHIVEKAETLFSLANLNFKNGKIDKAIEQVEKSISLTETIYYNVDNSGLQRAFHSKTYKRYDLYVKLLMNMHKKFPNDGYALRAFQAFEKSRSRSMIETLRLANENYTLDASPKIVSRMQDLSIQINNKNNELVNLTKANSKSDKAKGLKSKINVLKNEYENWKGILKNESPIYTQLKHPPVFNLKEFQNSVLDEDTVLLEFFIGKEESYLWLISKDNFEVFLLPECKNLDTEVGKLLKLLKSRSNFNNHNNEEYQKIVQESDKEYRELSKVISKKLLGKVYSKIKGKRWLIIPDGKLHYLPFSSLPEPNNPNFVWLLVNNEIIFGPSATMVKIIKESKKLNSANSKDFLVFSNPVFANTLLSKNTSSKSEGNVDKNSSDLNRLLPLKFSKREANTIFEIFDSKNSTHYEGYEANRDNFMKQNFTNYEVIHFATHGLYYDKKPEKSGILLSQHSKNGKRINEFIRLHDIYNKSLTANLVVLSACDTAIGEELHGEGILSLTNGFLQIGAKSVVSSHWKVNDYPTQLLMKYFYEFLSDETMTNSEALREAKLKLYRETDYKAPFYWAAFTIHGDFTNRPQVSTNFDYFNYSVFIGLIGFLFFGIKTLRNKRR